MIALWTSNIYPNYNSAPIGIYFVCQQLCLREGNHLALRHVAVEAE